MTVPVEFLGFTVEKATMVTVTLHASSPSMVRNRPLIGSVANGVNVHDQVFLVTLLAGLDGPVELLVHRTGKAGSLDLPLE